MIYYVIILGFIELQGRQRGNGQTQGRLKRPRATSGENDYSTMASDTLRRQSQMGPPQIQYPPLDTHVSCKCGQDAKLLTVRKEGPNTGKNQTNYG